MDDEKCDAYTYADVTIRASCNCEPGHPGVHRYTVGEVQIVAAGVDRPPVFIEHEAALDD
jgi:hypothetical protein